MDSPTTSLYRERRNDTKWGTEALTKIQDFITALTSLSTHF